MKLTLSLICIVILFVICLPLIEEKGHTEAKQPLPEIKQDTVYEKTKTIHN